VKNNQIDWNQVISVEQKQILNFFRFAWSYSLWCLLIDLNLVAATNSLCKTQFPELVRILKQNKDLMSTKRKPPLKSCFNIKCEAISDKSLLVKIGNYHLTYTRNIWKIFSCWSNLRRHPLFFHKKKCNGINFSFFGKSIDSKNFCA